MKVGILPSRKALWAMDPEMGRLMPTAESSGRTAWCPPTPGLTEWRGALSPSMRSRTPWETQESSLSLSYGACLTLAHSCLSRPASPTQMLTDTTVPHSLDSAVGHRANAGPLSRWYQLCRDIRLSWISCPSQTSRHGCRSWAHTIKTHLQRQQQQQQQKHTEIVCNTEYKCKRERAKKATFKIDNSNWNPFGFFQFGKSI